MLPRADAGEEDVAVASLDDLVVWTHDADVARDFRSLVRTRRDVLLKVLKTVLDGAVVAVHAREWLAMVRHPLVDLDATR